MERAGIAAANAVTDILCNKGLKRVLIFCGKGNNGGDGFVAARHLHNQGHDVRVIFLGKASELKPEAKINFSILLMAIMNWREQAIGLDRMVTLYSWPQPI